jgi:hypothetical protein
MFQFLHVHVLVTDGRFLSAGRDQLHQDLDGHRPNLWQEVEGLDVRNLMVNLIQQWKEQVYRQKMTVKVMKNMTNFIINIFVLAWLSNIFG